MKTETPEKPERSTGKTNDPNVKYPDRNDAPQHYTPHRSRHDYEGRRNQPRNASPKSTKRRQTAKHLAEVQAKQEMGVLAPFAPPSQTLEGQPEIF